MSGSGTLHCSAPAKSNFGPELMHVPSLNTAGKGPFLDKDATNGTIGPFSTKITLVLELDIWNLGTFTQPACVSTSLELHCRGRSQLPQVRFQAWPALC